METIKNLFFEDLQRIRRRSVSLLKGTAADLQSNKLFRLLQESSPLRVSPKKKKHPLPTILLGEREEKQRDGEKREDEREQRRAAGFTASLLTVCVCVTGTQLVTQHAAGVSEVRGCGWSLPVH